MKKTLLILFTAFTGYFAQAQTYYVNVNAVGANNGTTWADAFTDLNNALSIASSGEIWVAAGTYYPGTSGNTAATFALKNNLSILGGFNGSEALSVLRNPNTNVCILSGDLDLSGTLTANDAEHVVSAIDVVNTAILDGFSITGGNAPSKGGGILFDATGTGVFNPQIKNCNIYSNFGFSGGGVSIYNWYLNANLAPQFSNCKIHHNTATGWGGGVQISASGTAQSFASPKFENVLIYANTSQTGSGVASEHSNGARNDAIFVNCTVVNNNGGNNIMFQTYGDPGTMTFNNCIMYGEIVYGTDTITTNNSNIDASDTAYFKGTSNVYDYPMFVDTSNYNFQPGCSAQAINGGNNTYVTQTTDLAGVTRIIGLAVDMGVYETNYPPGPTVTANANFTSFCAPGSTNLILYGTGANTYTWNGGVSDSIPTTIISTATYTVTGYDANMCADTAAITITINELPSVTAPADYTICETDSIFLQCFAAFGLAPYTYSWQDGALNVISTTNSDYFTPTLDDNYTVNVTDANGCVGSDAMYISVDASEVLTGTAYIGATPINSGTVYLFRMNAVNLAFDTVSIFNITSGGLYFFPATPFGNYKLKVIADTALYPNAIPTYYGGGFQWDSAGTIVHNCLSTFSADVYLTTLLGGVGTGKITGKLIEAAGFGQRVGNNGNNHIMVPGGPLKGIDVKLGKNPGGGIQARTMSDTTGTYTFDSIPDDTYRIYVDIPGLGMDSFYVVSVNSTADTIINLDYYADNNSVYPILPTGVGLHQYASASANLFDMYPNPAKNITNLVFTSEKQNYATVHITDITGKIVMNITIKNLPAGKHEYQLNFSNQQLQSGIYFVDLLSEKGRQTKKLIVE